MWHASQSISSVKSSLLCVHEVWAAAAVVKRVVSHDVYEDETEEPEDWIQCATWFHFHCARVITGLNISYVHCVS